MPGLELLNSNAFYLAKYSFLKQQMVTTRIDKRDASKFKKAVRII